MVTTSWLNTINDFLSTHTPSPCPQCGKDRDYKITCHREKQGREKSILVENILVYCPSDCGAPDETLVSTILTMSPSFAEKLRI